MRHPLLGGNIKAGRDLRVLEPSPLTSHVSPEGAWPPGRKLPGEPGQDGVLGLCCCSSPRSRGPPPAPPRPPVRESWKR